MRASLKARVVRASWNTRYRRFIVLSRSRTGPTLLTSFLDSHPNVRARGEVLKTLNGRPVEQAILEQFGRQPRRIKARGFKVFYYHPLDDPDARLLSHLAAMDGLDVIHLRRRNILRTLVSRKIAGMQDAWTSTGSRETNGSAPLPAKQVSMTADELTTGFERTRAWEREGDHLFRDHPLLKMDYEDLVADPEGEFRAATSFLGVPYVAPRTVLERQNPEPLRDLLINHDELATAFAGTEWASFFADR
jgi:LPS sulfotransferase NodH